MPQIERELKLLGCHLKGNKYESVVRLCKLQASLLERAPDA
jgi:hypothetical protein